MKLGLIGLAASVFALGCTAPDGGAGEDPNEGLLRDFLAGKFDAAGHPINARVTEGEDLCPTAGTSLGSAVRLDTEPCVGTVAGAQQRGNLVASLRIRVVSFTASGTVVSARLVGAAGDALATRSLTTSQLRSNTWLDLPLSWRSGGDPVTLEIVPSPGAVIDLDYVEVFLERFGLVAAPGSGLYGDADRLVFELPHTRKLDRIELDGTDVSSRLSELILQGSATRTTTAFRTLVDVSVGDLAPERDDRAELELRAGTLAARMQLRREPTPCTYEGDPNGVKILITGFQPFPADGWHDNVSDRAIWALDPAQLAGAQVMRVTMPVEYDRAAAQLTDMIARCEPAAVISFGQGGNRIALEEVAYNLQDTGEIAGGVPDNRGIIRAAAQIEAGAPATRDTLLPLADIEQALVALGEMPRYSRDPGRYICNNVMFANVGTMSVRGGIGGFIHLPYTTTFGPDVIERFGKVVQAAVQATADSLR